MSVVVLSGWRKGLFDAGLALRVAFAGSRRLGLRRFVRELRAYLRDNRNLLKGSADRYVRRGRDVMAASALPPLNDPRFLDYLLDEVTSFNAGRLSPLVFVLLSVSARCPYRCRYCYALDDLRNEEVVPVESLEAAIRDLGRLRVPSVFLTGGEAMMRKDDLPRLLAAARESGVDAWLVTSGWGCDRASLAPLVDLGLRGVVVSLDSADPALAIESKSHKDAYANATTCIAAARDLGLVVSVDCMVGPDLLTDEGFGAYLAFLQSLGVQFVNFFPPHRIGGAAKNDVASLTTAELKRLEALMERNNRGAPNRDRPIAYSAVVWEAGRGCVGGQQFVYVNPLGEVRPCPFLPKPIGTITQVSLADIIRRLRARGEQPGCFDLYDGLPEAFRRRHAEMGIRGPASDAGPGFGP